MSNPSNPLAPLVNIGLTVTIKDNHRLDVSPASLLTDDLRQYIRDHKIEIMAELTARQAGWLAQSTWPGDKNRYADAARWAYTDLEHATRFPDYESCLAHCIERGLYRPIKENL